MLALVILDFALGAMTGAVAGGSLIGILLYRAWRRPILSDRFLEWFNKHTFCTDTAGPTEPPQVEGADAADNA